MAEDSRTAPEAQDEAHAREEIDAAAQEARRAAEAVGDDARRYAGDVANAAEEQKRGFAESLERAAGELQQSSGRLAESDRWTGDLFAQGASALRTFARQLDTHSLADMTAGTQDFARRHPGAFLAGAVAAGFVAARAGKVATARASGDMRATQGADGRDSGRGPGDGYADSTGDLL